VLFSTLDPSDASKESVSDDEMKGLERAILPVRCMLRIKKAILPVSAASPSGAVVGGQKVHVQDQETQTRESKRQTLKTQRRR
jgi:hypothetical protein